MREGGGTNSDASKSTMYCSHCYEAGKFTMPELTLQEMQARVKAKLREVGIPAFATGVFTRKISKLARWNTK